jgi:hypothetical protein
VESRFLLHFIGNGWLDLILVSYSIPGIYFYPPQPIQKYRLSCIHRPEVSCLSILSFLHGSYRNAQFLRDRIQRKTLWMGPYAGVDYNLTLCPLESRLQHTYHGNPMPESTLTLPMPESWIWPRVSNDGSRLLIVLFISQWKRVIRKGTADVVPKYFNMVMRWLRLDNFSCEMTTSTFLPLFFSGCNCGF